MYLHKALLIVDVQNDFCPGGALAVKDGDKVVEPLNSLINYSLREKWGLQAYSRDWHPRNTKHFTKWPVHCVANTPGAQFHPDLLILNNAFVVSKGMEIEDDGYSPFEGLVYGHPMEYFLIKYGIRELYIGGLATDYCVKAACLDARKLGYTTYLLLDACRAVNINPGDKEMALKDMNDAGVIFTTAEDVLNESQ